ncbi:MAG: electron transfer flavoprotein subunit alpha/FixB family protein [Chloroflexota bacterium]
MSHYPNDENQVWVWGEHYHDELARVSISLLGKARELSQQLGSGRVTAVLVGGSQKLASELIEYGADTVYLADASPFDTELCADLMARLVQDGRPEIVLWGATSLSGEIASRVAARVNTGLTAHCIDLYIEAIEGKHQLVTVVPGWGGNLLIKITCPQRRPQMATVKPGVFSAPERRQSSGEIIPVEVENKAAHLEIVEVVEERAETVSLEEARVVVAGGWGLNACGGFQPVEELAGILGGNIAGTRPAVDAGWIPVERMIGQSGKTIAPQLLITLGVSGAAQFTTAVTGAKLILAINKDPKALMFEMADIGIVGDLQEVLPKLIDRIKEIKEGS